MMQSSNNRNRTVSRRQMLQGATAAGIALPLAHTLLAGKAHAQTRAVLPEINAVLPSFSMAERDRRWSSVRANMARIQ